MAGIRRIKPEVEREILAKYATGTSAGKLAREYGIHRKTVTIIVRRNGGVVLDQRAAGGRPMIESLSFAHQAKAMHDSGMSNTAISKEIGFCGDVVRRMLRSVGIHRANPNLKREKHGSWKGGVVVTGSGYLAERVDLDSPHLGMAARSGYALQHRLVMARFLGRDLAKHETVHHVNGNKKDNRLENLQLRSGRHGKHECLRCRNCGSSDIEHVRIKDE